MFNHVRNCSCTSHSGVLATPSLPAKTAVTEVHELGST